jgi:endonuclease YncB( thermonuclease family)
LIRALVSAAVVLCAAQVEAASITGRGKAIDSTVVAIGDQRVMLFGVDSVMRKQACLLDGKPWQCWTAAVQGLQSLLDQGTVTCETVGDADVYGRYLGRCAVDGRSVNEEMVRRGFGVTRPSESSDYAGAESEAKASKAGLWQGQFMQPSEFRRTAGILVERP